MLIVELSGKGERKGRRGKSERKGREIRSWREEEWRKYRERTEKVELKGVRVGERMRELQEGMMKIIEEIGEGERGRAGRNVGWWDEECRECKNEVRKTLREWRKGRVQKKEYRNKKKIYKELCENKEREREVFIREVGRVRTEGEIWKVIRKQRGGKKRVNEGIKEKKWKEYFMNLMGGIEDRMKGGKRKAGGRVEDELERDEVEAVLRGLKKGK